MKKTLLIVLVLISVILSSCKKDDDFTSPENLVGTQWKSRDIHFSQQGSSEYYLLKFTSKTKVEFWIKFVDRSESQMQLFFESIYSIDGNKFNIASGYDGATIGSIEDNKIYLDIWGSGSLATFIKQ